MDEIRELGLKVLSEYSTNQNNVKLIENKIWSQSENNDGKYRKILYNVSGILMKDGAQEAYDYISNYNVEHDEFGCKDYQQIIKMQEEEEDFILNPVTVVEGVNTCHKCGSKKTISYSKQTRSADEGTTVFCCCYICGNKWKM